jgi:hypothetical protein
VASDFPHCHGDMLKLMFSFLGEDTVLCWADLLSFREIVVSVFGEVD